MRICVHGVGYVGLASAALFAHDGHDVVGYDPDEETIERLNRGEPRTTEPEFAAYVGDVLGNGLEPSHDPVVADCHVICVPTPYDASVGAADLSYVEAAARTVADLLRPGDAVVVESTVPPRTTEDVVAPALSAAGLTPGEDVSLAYCPETILPGNIAHELVNNDRIVGGVDDESTDLVATLFESCTEGTVYRAPDASTAEFAKLAQNAHRDVNVAFANELARLARDYGIDSRAAIDLANVHPRVDVLNPGPGVGGHCLPVDPWFLGQSSDELDLLAAARRVNDGMVGFVIDLLEASLGDLEDRRIGVLGVAYKGNVDDARHSPGLRLADALAGRDDAAAAVRHATADGGDGRATDASVDVRLHDPHVEDDRLVSLESAVDGADAIVVTAGHSEYRNVDPETIAAATDGRTIVDGPAVLDADAWREAGFDYVRI
ncbi:nucleotide sugar dehydrogenase [Halobaculum halobium]|uniref:UDP-N-acetyl-D-mannosamine dehydrogenase n=1 Tax=Halobaculum halobium TaxID=3032281 RepID=A0ABD5TB19_9EURY|nr:nucleotide sugar dehydrogenase [Halobaculum sp. SYNS20]